VLVTRTLSASPRSALGVRQPGRTSTGRSRRPRWDRGAAAVEFALVVPVLLLLVLGIAEFGRAYNIQTTVSGAAREGVRTMAVENDSGAARAATRNAAPALHLSDSQINVSPTTCPEPDTAPTVSAMVTVTYRMSFVTHLFANSLTLTGVGVMRCNG
jgi:Flp pilus assembly protein TadG